MSWWNGKDELNAFYRLPSLERIAIMALGLGLVTSVWQKTPTPARNLRRTATLSAWFRPRNRPHRHH